MSFDTDPDHLQVGGFTSEWFRNAELAQEEETFLGSDGYMHTKKRSDIVRELANATDELLDSIAERESAKFVQANPEYYQVQHNRDWLIDEMSARYLNVPAVDPDSQDDALREMARRGEWNVENLTAVFNDLSAQGILRPKPGAWKPLDTDQLAEIATYAGLVKSQSQADKVLQKYVDFALGKWTKPWKNIVGDPRYASLVREAAISIWQGSKPEWFSSEFREARLREYVGNRFPTFQLLDAALSRIELEEESLPLTPEEEAIVRFTRPVS